MSMVALALMVVLAVATATFYVAGGGYVQGSPWARDVCNLSRALCHDPLWLMLATAGTAGLYFVLRALRL